MSLNAKLDTYVAERLNFTTILLSGLLAFLASQMVVPAANARSIDEARLAAGWIDEVLSDVAASTKAIGLEYALRVEDPLRSDAVDWTTRAYTQGNTTGFRFWDIGTSEPASRAPFPSLYSYGAADMTSDRATTLNHLETMVPVLRSAYRSFGFSWVYFTTPDDILLIYPYVPLAEAVHNFRPTKQVYYTAADFKNRAVGWTAPYLDLVGAGMMITASYPVYQNNELLGVASRDITLTEMSLSILDGLAASGNTTALLVDENGLAIASSDSGLATEIDKVNQKAGDAVLFYRTKQGLGTLNTKAGQQSAQDWVNQAVERVIEAKISGIQNETGFEIDGRTVYSARIERLGWFVILIGTAP